MVAILPTNSCKVNRKCKQELTVKSDKIHEFTVKSTYRKISITVNSCNDNENTEPCKVVCYFLNCIIYISKRPYNYSLYITPIQKSNAFFSRKNIINSADHYELAVVGGGGQKQRAQRHLSGWRTDCFCFCFDKGLLMSLTFCE